MVYPSFGSQTVRLCLDVDIGWLGIELSSIPIQPSFGNGSQYQNDVHEIAR
jgi:hypothetical protein